VGVAGELAQQGPGIVGGPDLLEELVRGELLRGEVADVLVDSYLAPIDFNLDAMSS